MHVFPGRSQGKTKFALRGGKPIKSRRALRGDLIASIERFGFWVCCRGPIKAIGSTNLPVVESKDETSLLGFLQAGTTSKVLAQTGQPKSGWIGHFIESVLNTEVREIFLVRLSIFSSLFIPIVARQTLCSLLSKSCVGIQKAHRGRSHRPSLSG